MSARHSLPSTSKKNDTIKPVVSSGLVPAAVFIAVPNTPSPDVTLVPKVKETLSASLASTIIYSSLLYRSLENEPSTCQAGGDRSQAEEDGSRGFALAQRNNNYTSDESSPERTRRSANSGNDAAIARMESLQSHSQGILKPDEHHQLRENGRAPDDIGSDPDTSLYDYSGARAIESPFAVRGEGHSEADSDDQSSTISVSEEDLASENPGFFQVPPLRSPASLRTAMAISPRQPSIDEETIPKRVSIEFADLPVSQSTPKKDTSLFTPMSEEDSKKSSTPRQAVDLKEECRVLKDAVHRLNVELSKYHAKYLPLSLEDEADVGLPMQKPIPSWLIHTKFLAPLFLAYDDRLKGKDSIIKHYEDDLAAFRAQVEAVVNENRYLKEHLENADYATGLRTERRRQRLNIKDAPNIGPAEWQPLQKQARLVLEENELLLEQLQIQDTKLRETCRVHSNEVKTLTNKLTMAEASRNAIEIELSQLQLQFSALKMQKETIASQAKTKVDAILHHSMMADYKQQIDGLKESRDVEVDGLMTDLQAHRFENSNLSQHVANLDGANKRLTLELKITKKANRKMEDDMQHLQQILETLDRKRRSTRVMLTDVVRAADRATAERDALAKVALKKQERAKKKASGMIVESELSKDKLAEQLKTCREELDELEQTRQRMKEKEDEFNCRRREYEREIKHLKSIVSEKDLALDDMSHEKRNLQNEVEHVWQATSHENRRSKDALREVQRKLDSHSCLQCRSSQFNDNF